MPESPGPEFPDGPDFPEFSEDELSSVVFDENFVRAASVHEPSATERGAAIDSAPAPTSAAPERTDKKVERAERADWFDDGTYPPDGEDPWRARTVSSPESLSQSAHAHAPTWFAGEPWARAARATRWRRGVAWVLAVLMGVGVVAMAVTAVYRSGSSQSPGTPQNPSVDSGRSAVDDDPALASPVGEDTSRVRITLGPGDGVEAGAAGDGTTTLLPQPVQTRSGPG